jgi:hypothetical protein
MSKIANRVASRHMTASGHKVVICIGSAGLHMLSKEAREWLINEGVNVHQVDDSDIPRHDPRLVQCIETLGPRASEYAGIKYEAVGIPGNQYAVQIVGDYDSEKVSTPESMNWVTI